GSGWKLRTHGRPLHTSPDFPREGEAEAEGSQERCAAGVHGSGASTPNPAPVNALRCRVCRAANRSALAGLEALLGLVDDVDAALAAHELVVAVTGAQRLERVANLHRSHIGTDSRPAA